HRFSQRGDRPGPYRHLQCRRHGGDCRVCAVSGRVVAGGATLEAEGGGRDTRAREPPWPLLVRETRARASIIAGRSAGRGAEEAAASSSTGFDTKTSARAFRAGDSCPSSK